MQSRMTNQDHGCVKLMFYTSGTENMVLRNGQEDTINGPEGESFLYAWKDRDELITDAEMRAYGAEAEYGDDLVFGDLPGKVP